MAIIDIGPFLDHVRDDHIMTAAIVGKSDYALIKAMEARAPQTKYPSRLELPDGRAAFYGVELDSPIIEYFGSWGIEPETWVEVWLVYAGFEAGTWVTDKAGRYVRVQVGIIDGRKNYMAVQSINPSDSETVFDDLLARRHCRPGTNYERVQPQQDFIAHA